METTTMNALSSRVLRAGFAVHSALGPGMLEKTYETCLPHELELAGLQVERQRTVHIDYRGLHVDAAYRIDLVVAGSLAVEAKAVEALLPVHRAQLLTYLRLSGLRCGLLLNFKWVIGLREAAHRAVPRPRARAAQSRMHRSKLAIG